MRHIYARGDWQEHACLIVDRPHGQVWFEAVLLHVSLDAHPSPTMRSGGAMLPCVIRRYMRIAGMRAILPLHMSFIRGDAALYALNAQERRSFLPPLWCRSHACRTVHGMPLRQRLDQGCRVCGEGNVGCRYRHGRVAWEKACLAGRQVAGTAGWYQALQGGHRQPANHTGEAGSGGGEGRNRRQALHERTRIGRWQCEMSLP